MKKRLLSLLLVLALFLNFSFPAFATAEFTGESIGVIGYSESNMVEKNAEITLSTAAAQRSLYSSRTINIVPAADSNLPAVTLVGTFYPFPDGAYADSVIVGNFADPDGNTEVVQVRLSTMTDQMSVLEIVVQNKYTGNEARTYGQISSKNFSEIYSEAINNYNRFLLESENDLMSYKDFFVNLALGVEFSATVESSPVEVDSTGMEESSAFSTRSLGNELSDYEYEQLRDFVQALKTNNTITLSTYAISPDFLTSTGFDHAGDANLYAASKYTHDNGGGVYYTRLTIANLIRSVEKSNREIAYQMQYNWGVMIEYVEGTNYARLYLDDYGLKFKNVSIELEILGPSTNNFFTRSAVSGNITSFSVDVLALIGLVENFTIVATCLNSVKRNTTGEFNCGEILYGDTIDEQKKRWGDDQVVYQIVLSSDGNCMDCEGQNMKLEGKYNDNGVPTYSYSFSYTAGT